MDKKRVNFMLVLALIALVVASLACSLVGNNVQVGPLQTESQTVPLDGSESVDVEIDLGAGELTMTGGVSNLLEADFTYNVAELKPEVSYSGGTLSVRTPDMGARITSFQDMDDFRYEWDLRLNETVPMDMTINVGAGQSDLELGDLSLERLNVNSGAGEIFLDLSGSAELTHLDFQLGAGSATVDLTGDWQGDLEATIQAGVGNLVLRFPSDIGVRVDIEGGIQNVTTSGLNQDGGRYVNAAYGDSAASIRLDIEAGIGNIELRVIE